MAETDYTQAPVDRLSTRNCLDPEWARAGPRRRAATDKLQTPNRRAASDPCAGLSISYMNGWIGIVG